MAADTFLRHSRTGSSSFSMTPTPAPQEAKLAGDELRDAAVRFPRANLSRAQLEANTLAEELTNMRQQLKDLQDTGSSRRDVKLALVPSGAEDAVLASLTTDMTLGSESRALAPRMRDTRLVVGLEAEVERVKLDLDTETRHRMARDADTQARMRLLRDERVKVERELKEEHARSTRALEEEHASTTQELKDEHARSVQELKEELARSTQELKEEHARSTQELKEEHAKSTQELKEEHAKSTQELREAHAKSTHELKEEQAGLDRRLTGLAKELDTATQKLEQTADSSARSLEELIGNRGQEMQRAINSTKREVTSTLDSTTQELEDFRRILSGTKRELVRDLENTAHEVEVLKKDFNTHTASAESSHKALTEKEADTRRVSEESVCKLESRVEEVQQMLRKEVQERAVAQEELQHQAKEVQEVSLARMAKQLQDLQAQIEEVHAHGKHLQQQFASQDLDSGINRILQGDRDSLQKLSARIQELESSLGLQLKTLQSTFSSECSARAEAEARLDRRCTDLAAEADRLSAGRTSLADDLDQQIRQLRQAQEKGLEAGLAALRNLVAERLEAAYAARESLRGELAKEHAANDSRLEAQLLRHETAQQGHVDKLWQRMGVLERRHEELVASDRLQEADRIATLERLVQDGVSRERAAREAALEQMQGQERHARATHGDQVVALEARLSTLRSQVDELGDKQRNELAAKVREWQGSATTLEECGRHVQELRELCGRLDGRIAQEAQAERDARKDMLEQLQQRISKVEGCVQSIVGFSRGVLDSASHLGGQ